MRKMGIFVVASLIISLFGCISEQESPSTTSSSTIQRESKISDIGSSSYVEELPSVSEDMLLSDNDIHLLSLKTKSLDEYLNEDFNFLLNTKRRDIIHIFNVDLDNDCGTMTVESSTIPIYIMSIRELDGIVLNFDYPETDRVRTAQDILNEVPNFLFLSHNRVNSLRGAYFNDPIQTVIELLGETEICKETSLREMPEDWQACSLEYQSDGLTFRYYFEGSIKEGTYYLKEIIIMRGNGWNR